MKRSLQSRILFAFAAAACLSSAIAAQQATTMPESQSSTAQAPVAHSMAELRPGRIVLLREGSVLTQTVGVVRRDDDGRWLFVIDMPDAENEQLELILLPSSTFEEMQRIAESIDERELAFETTGEVFVYKNRNYLLPTHAPHLVETRQTQPPAQDQSAEDANETTESADENEAGEADDDSIESIMQRLEDRSGPLARSSAEADRATTVQQPTMQSSAPAESNLREGMSLLDRRGHLTRSRDGGWMFVFDADAEGLSDPPVRVLPCLMLERMQEYARQRSNIAPMLLSGRVYEYQGRRYVLPTLYRIPRMRTPMTP